MQVEGLRSFPSIAIDIFSCQIPLIIFNTLSGIIFFHSLKLYLFGCYFENYFYICTRKGIEYGQSSVK